MSNWDISAAMVNGITNLSNGHVPYRQLCIVAVAVRYCTDDPGSPSPASDLPELKRLLTADTQEPLPNQLRPRFHRHGLSQRVKKPSKTSAPIFYRLDIYYMKLGLGTKERNKQKLLEYLLKRVEHNPGDLNFLQSPPANTHSFAPRNWTLVTSLQRKTGIPPLMHTTVQTAASRLLCYVRQTDSFSLEDCYILPLSLDCQK